MSNLTIRAATQDDAQTILNFVRELAIYEKAEHEVEATSSHITRTLFGTDSTAHCILCESDGQPVGFAVYFFNYSTWQGRNGLYLEDLYVSQHARGMGAGKLLLTHLAAIAVKNDCGRFEWSVLDWNAPAIEFYESLGARAQSEWVKYRLDGEALTALASKA